MEFIVLCLINWGREGEDPPVTPQNKPGGSQGGDAALGSPGRVRGGDFWDFCGKLRFPPSGQSPAGASLTVSCGSMRILKVCCCSVFNVTVTAMAGEREKGKKRGREKGKTNPGAAAAAPPGRPHNMQLHAAAILRAAPPLPPTAAGSASSRRRRAEGKATPPPPRSRHAHLFFLIESRDTGKKKARFARDMVT